MYITKEVRKLKKERSNFSGGLRVNSKVNSSVQKFFTKL